MVFLIYKTPKHENENLDLNKNQSLSADDSNFANDLVIFKEKVETIDNDLNDSESKPITTNNSHNKVHNESIEVQTYKINIGSKVMHWRRPGLGVGIVLEIRENNLCTVKFDKAQFTGVNIESFGEPQIIEDHYDSVYRKQLEEKLAKEIKIRKEKAEKERLLKLKNTQQLKPIDKVSQLKIAHANFLNRIGKNNLGLQKSTKKHRVTHCYSCKKPLDNAIDLECVECEWIICKCGACGCGWSRYL